MPYDGTKAQWKQEMCEKAKDIWRGLHKLATIIAPIIPQPFKGPLELFNAISDVAVQYIDNEEKLKDAMAQLSARLVEVNGALSESDNYGIDVVQSSQQLAALVVKEALTMHKIQILQWGMKTLQQDDIAGQITACLDRLNQGTDQHHREMTKVINRVLHQNLQLALASTLSSFAPGALFDADAATGGPARRGCARDTRAGLMDSLKHWALDISSSPIFWLGGMAGTGKSTVAYTLCQHLRGEGRLGASFFCSRTHEKSRSRASIIPTIVRQLLYLNKPFAHSLGHVHLDDVIAASARHVDELLVQPWLRGMVFQSEERPPLVVVIDALDEIEGNDQGPQLIKQLIQAVSASETRLLGPKFFVTSRPHPGIMKECSSIERKAVYHMEEIAPKEAIEDVRRFVNAELGDLPRKRQEYIVINSAGLFIYAATVAGYVCPPGSNPKPSPNQQVKRLDKLGRTGFSSVPPDSVPGFLIASLYEAIISDVFRNVGQEVETSKRVLYAVVTTRRPLTVLDLAPLIFDAGDELDEIAVRNSLSLFYAVLYVSPRDNYIYTFHKSFADFILDPRRSPQLATPAKSYFRDRTCDCFRIMNKSLRFNICNLASSFLLDEDDKGLSERATTNIGPDVRYACQHWAAHLASVRHDRQEDVQQLAALLLEFYSLKVLFWMEAMNLLKSDCRLAIHLARTWALQVCIYCRQYSWSYVFLNNQLQDAELNVYMAAGQRLWASFICGQASLSTPHLYVSCLATELALTSAVDYSTLRRWRKHFPGLPSIECKGISRRGMLMSMQGHSNWVNSVAFSPNGALVVSGSKDETVRIWDVTKGAEAMKMAGHSNWVNSVSFSPDGARVVSGSHDQTVRIWDATTGAQVTKMEGHSNSVQAVGFSPDGAHIVSGSQDKTVRIWNATTGAEVTKMEGHSDGVRAVAFSPDGARVVSGAHDKTVRIWDARTGAEVTKMEGHSDWVTSVAFSPDGVRVVSGSLDEAVHIWDATTGAEVTKMEGHSDEVHAVAFSPDGVRIVSGSYDRTVRIWDATTGAEATKMEGHSERVTSVAFSLDGARIVSGSHDKTVRIWQRLPCPQSQKLAQLWIVQMDGWVVLRGHPHTRLFWYPPELQPTLLAPPSLHLISNMGQTRLEFHTCTLGPDWPQIYHSPRTYHPTRILFGILVSVLLLLFCGTTYDHSSFALDRAVLTYDR
ncbi:hypothetical protein DFH09DRAFT_470836 [Mycena vulgaris]|nr:hypothetical protein DFH09DRAFT_470836 [Mycena vulgaris]